MQARVLREKHPSLHANAATAMNPTSIVLALATGLGLSLAAHAADPNAAMRYAEIGVQRDANRNQSVLGTAALPVGERLWLQLGGGHTRIAQEAVEHRAGVFSAGAGYVGDGWLASVVGTHRGDGPAYRQTDWVGTVEWRGERFDIGLDGSHRDARQQGSVAMPTPTGGMAPVPVAQRLKGSGVGLHGGVMLGAKARLYAAAMRYDFRTETRRSDAAGGGDGLLGDSSLLARALSSRASLVSRDEAALSRSLQFGASYRVSDTVVVSAEYLGDKVLDLPGTVQTLQLKGSLELAPGWTVTPAAGRTHSDGYGGVNFASLTLRRAW